MAQQYWISDCFIDLNRNQITRNSETIVLPPKVLAVLTLLAENQGQVVSHDTIMDVVWKNTYVSSNSLQRSIAQLRKALGDDGKNQSIIKTHSKQGYSLEIDVNWQVNDETNNSANIGVKSESPNRIKPLLLVSFLLSSLIIFIYILLNNNVQPELSFEKLTPVTSSDAREGGASYSLDGEYIVFHRYQGACENQIWAKHLKTGVEKQLTAETAYYGSHDFSSDGKQLVFLANRACDAVTGALGPKSCWDLMTLDFQLALKSPTQAKRIKQCDNVRFNEPFWLNDGSIAMLQKHNGRWKIMKHFVDSEAVSEIYTPTSKTIYSVDYSKQKDSFAIVSVNDHGEHILELMSSKGKLLSSAKITKPTDLSPNLHIYPNFDISREQLVFTTKKKLYALSYEGNIRQIKTPVYESIYETVMHAGGKKAVATYGTYDTDIVKFSLDSSYTEPTTVSRSISTDSKGKFQPDGDHIAMISERSGTEQLWITNLQGAKQLTQFPFATPMTGLHWVNQSQLVLIANSELYLISVTGDSQKLDLGVNIIQLLPSTSRQYLLLHTISSGQEKLQLYDLQKKELKTLTSSDIRWAVMNKERHVVYRENDGGYWLLKNGLQTELSELNNERLKRRFVISGNKLFGLTANNKIWQYDIQTDNLQTLQQAPEEIVYLTDIKNNELLGKKVVAKKKEIIELMVKGID